MIAENMLSQVDSDGFSLTLMDAIIDYRCTNTAIDKKDGYVYTKSGQKRKQKTTAGWELLVKWKDESEATLPIHTNTTWDLPHLELAYKIGVLAKKTIEGAGAGGEGPTHVKICLQSR